MSANVPMSSSVAIASPKPLPITPPVNGPIIFLPVLFKLKSLPAFLAAIALSAISFAWKAILACEPAFPFKAMLAVFAMPLANCAPLAAPKTPPVRAKGTIVVIASVILPTARASASSSNGLISSNHLSTSAALLVSPIKSINSAPTETKLFGIFITPDATPANADSQNPTSSSILLASVTPKASLSV